MKFTKTDFDGVYLIEIEKSEDERGFFARTFDSKIFEEKGLIFQFIQSSISNNIKKGTIRGMHYQIEPYAETKLVTCTNGKIFDVLIDLRPNSKTFKKWQSFELDSKHYSSVYIPEGVAHGFQTLQDDSVIHYQISQIHKPEFSRGIRWDDKLFNITWPLKPTVISKKDQEYLDHK
jgi:dTDP-4-dehydrorhamnose 3,5-epimerase|tara:strand:+ start:2071 stop:2598 length:528 start_codon:yes stop_codon:yes gene_type:complete